MDRIAITGGARLEGIIPISGAKNSAIKLMTASLLTDQPLRLTNMPRLADTRFLAQLLRRLGVEVDEREGAAGPETVLHAPEVTSAFAPYDLVRQMRASFNVLGPLLARTGHAKVSLPGGCAIGARPVDLHLKALEALGAHIDLHEGYVYAQAPRGLKGAEIEFPISTVGATEHTLLAAVLAEGVTEIKNAAREPEIEDLANCLNAMGAKVEGAGTHLITITGVSKLHGATYAVMPDRIETGTYAVAAAMAGGEVRLTRTRSDFIQALLDRIEEAGAEVVHANDGVIIKRNGARLKAVDIETDPYPGLATDLQAQFMALMTIADGESVIKRDHLREPLHARPGAFPPRRRHHRPGRRGAGARGRKPRGRAGDGDRLARLGQPGDRRSGRARRDGGQPRLSPRSRLRAAGGEARRLRREGSALARRRGLT